MAIVCPPPRRSCELVAILSRVSEAVLRRCSNRGAIASPLPTPERPSVRPRNAEKSRDVYKM